MKVVKETLYEKFKEQSDPVKDMGIGIPRWEDVGAGSVLQIKKHINNTHPLNSYIVIDDIYRNTFGESTKIFYYNCKNKDQACVELDQWHKLIGPAREWAVTDSFLKQYFKIVPPWELKESVNEKFSDVSDPIEDLGIGTVNFIRKALEQIKKEYMEYVQVYMFRHFSLTEDDDLLCLTALDIPPNTPYIQETFEKYGLTDYVIFNTESSKDYFGKNSFVLKIKPEYIPFFKEALGKNKVNEKFEEQSDPIHDMGIGLRKLVIDWLKEYIFYDISNDVTINKNGEINFHYGIGFVGIPNFPNYIKFNEIGGNFTIKQSENFNSLDGFPKHIKGDLKFHLNGITPTEEEIRKICQVDGEVQLVDDYTHTQRKYKKKYKRLGPILKRPSPIINDKTPHQEQLYSRGYVIWNILKFIESRRKYGGARYKDIVNFDSKFKGLTTPRRTVSTGIFSSIKRYTNNYTHEGDYVKHRYFLTKDGEKYLEKYRDAFEEK